MGAVQDWLVTPWAVCNLADLAIVLGAVGVVGSFRNSQNRHLQVP
jgi:lipoprotein signal peptidase